MLRVDGHFHIWNLAERAQDWMTPDLEEVIGGPYGMADWSQAAGRNQVSGGVFVQTVAAPDETPEILQIAARNPDLLGVVGWVDVSSADETVIGQSLDALLASPGGDHLVGVRVQAEYQPDDDWLDSAQVHAAARALAARDLTLDLLTKPSQLAAAARLANAHPLTRMVLDHLSKPSMRKAEMASWADGVADLARSENVACKLSGFLTFDDQAMTADRLRPCFDVVHGVFGPERIIFGSDWPVSVLGGGYDRAVGVVEALVEDLDQHARARVWHGTALEWYPGAARALRQQTS